MTHPRFLAILGHRDPRGIRAQLEARAAKCGLDLVLKTAGMAVYSDQTTPLVLAESPGVILGTIRRAAPPMPDFEPAPDEQAAISVTRGGFLIERCWGDYVAILASRSGDSCAVRPPFSDLGCHHAAIDGLAVVGSSPALLRQVTLRAPEPDWSAIAHHLLTVGLRQPATCLAGIDELLWGARLVVEGDAVRTERCWTPWRFAAQREHDDAEHLAETLRTLALGTVAATLRPLDHVAVMLSGGLDSSILAACVAGTETRLTCLNLTSGDAIGDERIYASLVAQTLGSQLYDAEHRVEDVDIARSDAAHLARPIARSFAQASRVAKQRMARAAGAQAILDGGGGDNLFCYLQSAAPVADRLLRSGPGRAAARTAIDIALLTETSIFKVLSLGVRRAFRRSRDYRWETDPRYLTALAIKRAGPIRHDWLDAPPGALPGSASHIAMMAVVEGLLETSDDQLAERSPLMNQPLVEFCLSIPSWLWFERGHNRVVARRAFARDLPPEIAWRRSKGTPDGFVARVFEANRGRLGGFLCEGRLAGAGLLDRDAVARTIATPGPVRGHDHIRLLRIADVEAWVRGL